MKVGDLVWRTSFMDDDHVCGIIMKFDRDGDPIIYWNGGSFEEEYSGMVEVISENR